MVKTLKYNSKFFKIRENEFSLLDYLLIFVVLAIMIVGILTLRSVVKDTPQQARFTKQIVWNILGIAIMLYVVFEKETRIKSYAKYIYVISVMLLVVVLILENCVRCTSMD